MTMPSTSILVFAERNKVMYLHHPLLKKDTFPREVFEQRDLIQGGGPVLPKKMLE